MCLCAWVVSSPDDILEERPLLKEKILLFNLSLLFEVRSSIHFYIMVLYAYSLLKNKKKIKNI